MRAVRSIGLVVCAVFGGLGCSEAGALFLDFADFRTLVGLYRSPAEENAHLSVRALDPDAVIRFDFEPDDELQLLRFRAPPEALLIEPGDFVLSESGRRAPPPDEVLILRHDRLIPAQEGEIDLSTLRLPWRDGTHCLHISLAGTIEVPDTERDPFVSVVSLGAGRALVALARGAFYELSRNLELRPVLVDSNLPSHALYGDPSSDEVWLVGGDGRVARGHPDRGFEMMPSHTATTAGLLTYFLDGGRNGAQTELLLASPAGRIEHYDGTSWNRVLDDPTNAPGGVLWAGPGRGIVADMPKGAMLHYEGGELQRRALPLIPGDQIKSLQFVDGYGPVVGSFSGKLFRFDGESWLAMPAGPTGLRVFTALPRVQGLIYGGQDGTYLQLVEEHPFCDGQSLTDSDLRKLVWIDDKLVGCGGRGLGKNMGCAAFELR